MFFAARAANFYLVLLHEAADIGDQHLCRPLEAEHIALDGHVVAAGVAPLRLAVVVVVGLSGAVDPFDLLDRVLGRQALLLHHTADFGLLVAADENAQHIGVALEHLVAAAADDEEALAICRLVAQHGERLFRHVDLKRIRILADAARGKEVDGLFIHLADHFLAVAFGNDLLFDGVLVIELDTELLRDHVGNVM